MFSLIVSIISIALVAVLAAASIYYGGDAFTKGSAKALASTVVTQAQQISSANTLYKNDKGGVSAANVAALTAAPGNYLASAPAMPSKVGSVALEIAADIDTVTAGNQGGVSAVITNAEVCKLINQQANGTDNFNANSQFGCEAVGASNGVDGIAGTADDVAGVLTFKYKG